jgi:hypothetical protein
MAIWCYSIDPRAKGVTGVSDEIGIKPSVTATAVEADIEAALKRPLIADARACVTAHTKCERSLNVGNVFPNATSVAGRLREALPFNPRSHI